jgi:hypothetical protein
MLVRANELMTGDRVVTAHDRVRVVKWTEVRTYGVWIKWTDSERLVKAQSSDRFEIEE